MKTVYLIRHGEIEGESPRRFIGSTDLPLTPRGREQIAALRSLLLPHNIERIVCSPLSRCQESGEILAASLGAAIETEQKFSEIHLGDWEGLTVAEVKSRFPGEYEARGTNLPGYRPPGGESFMDLLNRVLPALLHLLETSTSSPTAVVAHAGVHRVLLSHILGIPLCNMFRLQQDYGCYNVLYADKKGLRAGCINCTPD